MLSNALNVMSREIVLQLQDDQAFLRDLFGCLRSGHAQALSSEHRLVPVHSSPVAIPRSFPAKSWHAPASPTRRGVVSPAPPPAEPPLLQLWALLRELCALASSLHPIERARFYRALCSAGLLPAARTALAWAEAPAAVHVRCCDTLAALANHNPSVMRMEEIELREATPAAAAAAATAAALSDNMAVAAAAAVPALLVARSSTSLLLASRLCDTADEGVARQCCELLTVLLDPTTMEGVEEESFIEAAYCTARDELGDLDSAGGGAAWSGVDGTGASTSHWRAGRGSQDSPQADTAQNISHVEGCVSYLVRELAAMGERAKTAASLSRELVVCADGPGTVGASAELPIEIRAPIVLDLIVSFIGRHRQRGLEVSQATQEPRRRSCAHT